METDKCNVGSVGTGDGSEQQCCEECVLLHNDLLDEVQLSMRCVVVSADRRRPQQDSKGLPQSTGEIACFKKGILGYRQFFRILGGNTDLSSPSVARRPGSLEHG